MFAILLYSKNKNVIIAYMNKQELLKQYKNEDKLLVAKLLDKLEYCNKNNKISNTNFVNEREKRIVINVLNKLESASYIIYGGYEEAQRNIIIFYPKHFTKQMLQKNYNSIMQVIRIELPEELYNAYSHRDYLSGIIKIGINREKVGDILVNEKGADILVLKEVANYIEQNISQLTRFSKAKVIIKELEKLQLVEQLKEEIQIIVPSLRLDNIVSELARTSRNKANELIVQERVLVNYETVTKNSKLLKEKDVITIRGKGKFEFIEQIAETKKKNKILKIYKYI